MPVELFGIECNEGCRDETSPLGDSDLPGESKRLPDRDDPEERLRYLDGERANAEEAIMESEEDGVKR